MTDSYQQFAKLISSSLKCRLSVCCFKYIFCLFCFFAVVLLLLFFWLLFFPLFSRLLTFCFVFFYGGDATGMREEYGGGGKR